MMKRREVQILRRAGTTAERIVETTGVSKRSVWRIAKEPECDSREDAAARRRPGRPSKVEAYRGVVAEILAADPELPTMEILHRARERGYAGGKSALYDLVASMRTPTTCAPMVRFEGLPGEFSQHDFGEVVVRYASGATEKLHFFGSRLKYSRWIDVRVVPDQKVESLVRSLLSSFEAFGGVPLVCVFDNPKTVVLRRLGDKIEWNPTFGQVALDYRFGPELCTPARGQEKGAVENLVGFVKRSFFKVRRFVDREDLLAQLAAWHSEVNEQRPCRATSETPLARMTAERERLRCLAIAPADYPLRFATMVGPTGLVEHEGHRYSMPPESIGFPATLFVYPDRVRVQARKYEALHERRRGGPDTSWLPGHRAAMLSAVSGKRAKLYFKRERILALGGNAETLLTEIVHAHPRTWPAEVEILFGLLERFGDARMTKALEVAVARRLFGAHFVQGLLQRGVA